MDLSEFNRKASAQGYPDSKTVTETQRAFLAGIFAMNPLTPPGLPYGDKAVLVTGEKATGGLVFFLDDRKACDFMPVPKELIDLLMAIGRGDVAHEGDGL